MMISNVGPNAPQCVADIQGEGDMLLYHARDHSIATSGCRWLRVQGFEGGEIPRDFLARIAVLWRVAKYVFR